MRVAEALYQSSVYMGAADLKDMLPFFRRHKTIVYIGGQSRLVQVQHSSNLDGLEIKPSARVGWPQQAGDGFLL